MKKYYFATLLAILTFISTFGQKVNETVSVYNLEERVWYDATIKEIKDTTYFIHYDGYDSEYDEWVGKSFVKTKCPKLDYLSNSNALVPDAFSMVDKGKREKEKVLKVFVIQGDWTYIKNAYGVITSRILKGVGIVQNTETNLCFEIEIDFTQQNTSSGGDKYGITQFSRKGTYENAYQLFSIDCLK